MTQVGFKISTDGQMIALEQQAGAPPADPAAAAPLPGAPPAAAAPVGLPPPRPRYKALAEKFVGAFYLLGMLFLLGFNILKDDDEKKKRRASVTIFEILNAFTSVLALVIPLLDRENTAYNRTEIALFWISLGFDYTSTAYAIYSYDNKRAEATDLQRGRTNCTPWDYFTCLNLITIIFLVVGGLTYASNVIPDTKMFSDPATITFCNNCAQICGDDDDNLPGAIRTGIVFFSTFLTGAMKSYVQNDYKALTL